MKNFINEGYGPKADVKNKDGWNGLHGAIEMPQALAIGVIKATKYRNREGNIINSQTEDSLSTPMHIAAKKGDPNIAKELMSFPHLDLNIKDKDGNLSAHIAAKQSTDDLIILLLTNDTVNLTAENNEGKLISDVASICNKERLAGDTLIICI